MLISACGVKYAFCTSVASLATPQLGVSAWEKSSTSTYLRCKGGWKAFALSAGPGSAISPRLVESTTATKVLATRGNVRTRYTPKPESGSTPEDSRGGPEFALARASEFWAYFFTKKRAPSPAFLIHSIF